MVIRLPARRRHEHCLNLSDGVDNLYHAHFGVMCRQSGGQRRTERRETARSWRVRAKNPERPRATVGVLNGQIRDAQNGSSKRLG